jgi:hypothetical protein
MWRNKDRFGTLRQYPPVESYLIQFTLVPLGEYNAIVDTIPIWDPAFSAFRQSVYFKEKVIAAGVFDCWDVHGFPPQCKKLGAADFECP